MVGFVQADERLPERERWTQQEWAITIGMCIVFPPIGIAALIRKLLHKRVWH
jgi:hypothetical protein